MSKLSSEFIIDLELRRFLVKNEMYNKIAEDTGVSKNEVEAIIKALSDELLEVIAANDSFKLGDVVTIKGIEKPARTCRNPRTGEIIKLPARPGVPKAVFSKKVKM